MRIVSRRKPSLARDIEFYVVIAAYLALWIAMACWLGEIVGSLLGVTALAHYCYTARNVHFVLELHADRLIYSERTEEDKEKWNVSAGRINGVRRVRDRHFLHLKREKILIFTDLDGREYRARARGFARKDVEALLQRLPLLQPQTAPPVQPY